MSCKYDLWNYITNYTILEAFFVHKFKLIYLISFFSCLLNDTFICYTSKIFLSNKKISTSLFSSFFTHFYLYIIINIQLMKIIYTCFIKKKTTKIISFPFFTHIFHIYWYVSKSYYLTQIRSDKILNVILLITFITFFILTNIFIFHTILLIINHLFFFINLID